MAKKSITHPKVAAHDENSHPAKITLVREFESERDYILYVARQNFRFANLNGSSKEFSWEKMASAIRHLLPSLKWDKSALRRFSVLEDGEANYINPVHLPMEDVVTLLGVSIAMRDKVEPHVNRALDMIRAAEKRGHNEIADNSVLTSHVPPTPK